MHVRSLLPWVITAAGFVLLWILTPLRDLADIEKAVGYAKSISGSIWTVPALLTWYAIAGVTAFPVTIIIVCTATILAPWPALVTSASGLLISAVITYAVGKWLIKDAITRRFSEKMALIARHGTLAVAIIRAGPPLAPYAVVSAIAGAIGLRFTQYLAGTAIGMLPGLIATTFLGHEIGRAILNPTLERFGILLAVAIMWLLSAYLVRAVIRRLGTQADAGANETAGGRD